MVNSPLIRPYLLGGVLWGGGGTLGSHEFLDLKISLCQTPPLIIRISYSRWDDHPQFFHFGLKRNENPIFDLRLFGGWTKITNIFLPNGGEK